MRNVWERILAWLRVNRPVWVVLLVLLAVDRLSKRLTLEFLSNQDIIVAPFLHLRYVQNTGAAFGMMQGGNLLLILITLVILAYLIKSWRELCGYGPLVKWGLVFILGGALGNLYDRISLGFVVDFIDLRVWPVFNAADSFITVGGVLLAWALIFSGKTPKREEE